MVNSSNREKLLERVDALQHDLECLKREIIHNLATPPRASIKPKPSLFGSVQGGDITEEMIEEAKRDLFREFEEV